ncbi:MAG: ABC transporter substrate-binding protein [Hahellaceae bacterium]|nr:ABC transporter substrate-binding protein [Hahellaceae bacterium]
MAIACLSIAACHNEAAAPLKIGSNVWPGYETLYLARSLDWLPESSVKLVELPSSTDVSLAMRNHLLDGACLTLDEALLLLQHDIDISILLVMDFSSGGDVLLGKAQLDDLQSLKGKRIGVENNAVGAIVLDSALRKAGLRINDVTLIKLTVDEQESAFVADNIDALVTFDPVSTRLINNHQAHVLFSSKEIPGRIVDVLVIRNDLPDVQKANIQMLVDAHFKALGYLQSSPESAAGKMAPRLDLTPEELEQAYQGLTLPSKEENRRFLTGAPSQMQLRAEELARLMLNNNLISAYPRIGQITHRYWLGD